MPGDAWVCTGRPSLSGPCLLGPKKLSGNVQEAEEWRRLYRRIPRCCRLSAKVFDVPRLLPRPASAPERSLFLPLKRDPGVAALYLVSYQIGAVLRVSNVSLGMYLLLSIANTDVGVRYITRILGRSISPAQVARQGGACAEAGSRRGRRGRRRGKGVKGTGGRAAGAGGGIQPPSQSGGRFHKGPASAAAWVHQL